MRLTNTIIGELSYVGKKTKSGHSVHYVWDDIAGFGVRVYPTGRKSFIIKYRNKFGKQRYLTLGSFPELSASQARKEAEKLRAIIREGGDPKQDAVELRGCISISELFDAYLQRHCKVYKKTWKNDEQRIQRHVLHRWGNLSAGELTRRMVEKAMCDVRDGKGSAPSLRRTGKHKIGGPIEANHFVQLVHHTYDWADNAEILPAEIRNPARKIRKFKSIPRDRWLRPIEMHFVLRALDEHGSVFSRGVLQFIFLTAARSIEAKRLRWDDVDFTNRIVTFTKTKNGKDHHLPLSRKAILLLESLPRLNQYVFPGTKVDSHLQSVSVLWTTVRRKAEEISEREGTKISVMDVTGHDMRRSVASWMASAGETNLIIARVLNHTPQGVTGGTYAHLDKSPIMDALESHSQRLESCKKDKGWTLKSRVSTETQGRFYGILQLTRDQALAFSRDVNWNSWSDDKIVKFQLFQTRSCVGFDRYLEAIENVLGREIYIHELGIEREGLISEYLERRPAPSNEDLLKDLPSSVLGDLLN